MCQQCLNHARRIFPSLPESDIGELLFGATAFPFAEPGTIERQLLELKEQTDGTLNGMLAFADHELWEAMKEVEEKD